MRDLKTSIFQLLPSEFIKGGSDKYLYSFIENGNTLTDIKKKRVSGRIHEISYNHLWSIPLDNDLTPIQITTTIQNSQYIPRCEELDQDVVEYLLTALLITPPVEDRMITSIENSIRDVYKIIHPYDDFSQLPFDRYSTIKIANAFCRLELKEKLNEDMFNKSRNMFKDLSYTFLDAKNDLIKTKPNRETWDVPDVAVSYLDKWRSSFDTEVLRAISKLSDEQGIKWITRQEIKLHLNTKLEYDDSKLVDSLMRLNNLGVILSKDNGMQYKIIKYD